jgi:hypothetical protein
MGCSTLTHEQSSNCHFNTFLWIILWELCMAFHFSTQLEEGGPMGAQEGNFFLPLLHTKMHYPGVKGKKNPNTFFLACAVIGYTMNTDWIIH